jgi:hypothetical protein
MEENNVNHLCVSHLPLAALALATMGQQGQILEMEWSD